MITPSTKASNSWKRKGPLCTWPKARGTPCLVSQRSFSTQLRNAAFKDPNPCPQACECIFKSAKNCIGMVPQQEIQQPCFASGFMDPNPYPPNSNACPIHQKCTQWFCGLGQAVVLMRLTGAQNASRGFVDRQKRFWLMRLTGPKKCICRFLRSAHRKRSRTEWHRTFLAGTDAALFIPVEMSP